MLRHTTHVLLSYLAPYFSAHGASHCDVRHRFRTLLVDPFHHRLELLARTELIELRATLLDRSFHALVPQHWAHELVAQQVNDVLNGSLRANGCRCGIHVHPAPGRLHGAF